MAVHGNRLEDLRAVAVEWMRRHPLAPLENEVILVQSNGIAQWLRLALARHPGGEEGGAGIAAALEVDLPARFLWKAYRAVLGDEAVPETSPFAREPLVWRLMRLLPDCLDDPSFAPLRRFLEDDDDLRKRHQLAQRLADLLDQYQVYRADWLDDWARGRDRIRDARGGWHPLDGEGNHWQPALWRALLADMGSGAGAASRAGIHTRFMERVPHLETRPTGLPRRVMVFGVSALPAQMLEALEGISRFTQVLLCVHNPCRHYWADIIADKDLLRAPRRRQARKAGMPGDLPEEDLHHHAHPLLASWGRQGRDYIRMLDAHDDPVRYRGLLEDLPWERIDLFEPHGGHTLLQQLQDDILELRSLEETRDQWGPVDPARDDSLRFHVTHGPQREVEVLHDRLLDRFSRDPSLRPRDIIVMVPDIDRYAPHVQAVFGQIPREDDRHIPITLTDLGQRGRDPVLVVLEQLLRLPESRIAVSDLLDLLDLPAVRMRFGLSRDQLPQLHEWIRGAGIRWGLHARQRASLDLPGDLEQNTWRFGWRRMLLGYAAGDGGPWHGIEPFDEVGGLDAALAGPLTDLLDALERWWALLARPATPAEWGSRLRNLVADFLAPGEEVERIALMRADEALEQWVVDCAVAGMEEPLPLSVVREHWLGALETPRLSQRFLTGSVTICTLMPMRAIPFRVVCLLGMNDGDYPRTRPPLDFDLMARDPRPGDRSRREDDRYLFLEALLSARDHCHVSWVGRDARDNAERPPSVLVSQLREHLAAGWIPVEEGTDLLKGLTLEHPLQPFARSLFEPDSGVFTYAREWEGVHAPARTPGVEPSAPLAWQPPEEALDTDALGAFLKDPVGAFFSQRLRVRLDRTEAVAEDQEPFALDGLETWQAVSHLVEAALHPAPGPDLSEEEIEARLEASLAGWRRAGHLPPGGVGVKLGGGLKASAQDLVRRYLDLVRHHPHPVRVPGRLCFTDGEVTLEDWLPPLWEDGTGRRLCLRYEPGRLRAGQTPFLRLDKCCHPWVMHLLAHVEGEVMDTCLVGVDDTLHLPALDPETARTHLIELLRGWREGFTRPLPVFCQGAGAWLRVEEKGPARQAGDLRRLYEGEGNRDGERDRNPALARAWPEAGDLLSAPDFTDWVRTLYAPLWTGVTPYKGSDPA
ncbi:MAG: exodeoxyribonuclease V subunit gamma [Ectothiorhodospira sp.]